MIMTIKPTDQEAYTFNLLSENFGHQTSHAMHLQKSEATILLIKRLGIQLISSNSEKYEDALTMVTPYYHFECLSINKKESQLSLHEGSITYGIPGGQERGIGYSVSTTNKEGSDYENKIVIKRPNHVLKNMEHLTIIQSFIDSKNALELILETEDPNHHVNFKVEQLKKKKN